MMPPVYHLDYETYSPQPFGGNKSVGAFRYAEDDEAAILVLAIREGDGPIKTWDELDGDNGGLALLKEACENPDAIIWAHNAQFEHAVSITLLHTLPGFADISPPQIEQWRCTAAMARLAAIPSSLDMVGEFLHLDLRKDKEGTKLIELFSKPSRPQRGAPSRRIMPDEEPEKFRRFVQYCIRDVEVECLVEKRLSIDFPLEGWALESFQLDMHMNTNGIPVNVGALEHASKLMEEYLEQMVPVFRSQVARPNATLWLPVTKQRKARKEVDISEGFNPSQRELFLEWLCGEGFTANNLQAPTVELWLEEGESLGLSEEGRTALETYSLISSAAVKKIPAMLTMACKDGYVRGGLMVFGAERTHRWAGKGIQPQNFARPKVKFTELAYEMICNRASLNEIQEICGDFFHVLVSVIRHFIQPQQGTVLQADYSAIEARVAPWLVGAESKLEMFRNGEPIYEMMAQKIFGGPLEAISGDQRFIGKQAELGCTYNMGVPKFRGTCESYGFTPPKEMVIEFITRNEIDSGEHEWEELVEATYDDLADRAVGAWRRENHQIVKAWKKIEDAAIWCIQHPRKVKTVGRLQFCHKQVAQFGALLIKLPSGHKLVYPRPQLKERDDWRGMEIQFWGIVPNSGGKWSWCSTYGGKILENCTQAASGDVMRVGMANAWAEDYKAFMLVHDELLSKKQPGQTHERLCELLCQGADWMEGLPLAAEGAEIPFYKK